MTLPLLGDSSDRVIEMSKAQRVQGWYVDRSLVPPNDPTAAAMPTWIEFIERNPDATLPNGVGGAVVTFLKDRLDARARDAITLSDELTRVAQASGAPDPFAVADHVFAKMYALTEAEKNVAALREGLDRTHGQLADANKRLHDAADSYLRIERQLAETKALLRNARS